MVAAPPYRTNAPRPPKESPPRELVYESEARTSALVKDCLAIAAIQIAIFVVFHKIGGAAGGIAAAVAATLLWWRRPARRRRVKVLHVERGVLTIAPRDGESGAAHFYLRDLDVVLDTKTIRKVVDGDSMLAAVRFTSSKVGPEIDTSRIVFTSGAERHALSERFLSHMEAIDWFGKIRVFLRKNGWVPADERDLS